VFEGPQSEKERTVSKQKGKEAYNLVSSQRTSKTQSKVPDFIFLWPKQKCKIIFTYCKTLFNNVQAVH
jgi:hypothetical protein